MRHFETITSNGAAVLDRPPGHEWAEEVEEDWQSTGWLGPSVEVEDREPSKWLYPGEGPHMYAVFPFALRDPDLQGEFDELASVWDRETSIASFVPQKAMHWAYQRIIGKGPPVVPLILERLRDHGPDHWFWALAMITGEDPARGLTTLREATEAWLSWGRGQGLI